MEQWTRETRYVTRIALYTDVDDECDKVPKVVVGGTLIVTNIVSFVRPLTVANLLFSVSSFVEL